MADHFGLEVEVLSAKKKTADIVLARHVGMYLTRLLTKSSLKAVGDSFGGRDHSTVIHACNLIERLKEGDHQFRLTLETLAREITG